LKGLNPGNEYEIVLSAVNKKGRSPPFSLSAYTLKVPEKHTDLAMTVTTALMQKREILMMLAGSVIGIIVIALLITIVAKVRGSRGLDSKPMTSSSLPPMPHNMDGLDHHHQQQQHRQHQQESPDSSDKNPDIIPHTTLEEWQEANKQIYGSMHYRIPTLQQPQTAAAYNPTANGMIIYSGATMGRMNNNFKRIDSNGICAQQVNLSLSSIDISFDIFFCGNFSCIKFS
jgi:hypothetical protein